MCLCINNFLFFACTSLSVRLKCNKASKEIQNLLEVHVFFLVCIFCVFQSVQAVFKSLASLDRSVEKCRIQLNSEKSRLTITLHCKHGKSLC